MLLCVYVCLFFSNSTIDSIKVYKYKFSREHEVKYSILKLFIKLYCFTSVERMIRQPEVLSYKRIHLCIFIYSLTKVFIYHYWETQNSLKWFQNMFSQSWSTEHNSLHNSRKPWVRQSKLVVLFSFFFYFCLSLIHTVDLKILIFK